MNPVSTLGIDGFNGASAPNRSAIPTSESDHFLRALTPEQVDCATRCLNMRVRTFNKGEVLLACTGDTSTLGIMLSGTGQDIRLHANGERTLVDVIETGEIFGDGWHSPHILQYDGPKERAIIAATEVQAVFFAPERLHDDTISCSVQSVFRQEIWRLLLSKQERLRAKIEMLHHRSLRKRICAFLLTESLRRRQKTFMLVMSRKELAEYLHADRAALSRELSNMRKDGLIDYWRNAFSIQSLSEAKLFPE
ncbi:MAG: Crp/Fnr family transcriptional regulator [Yaniella sp.]|uniref:Crp/Fnr family transcriptional regulator n=1 Tax=Yaniella sp. TaxID=2773929 RepID=UPI0026479909|nr:Crp/Fnr family transcriptional regulator [Yaniella sp.]MDN6758270.1 Crp/Fnr family transcriptional regulator [Yaniella sp.]